MATRQVPNQTPSNGSRGFSFGGPPGAAPPGSSTMRYAMPDSRGAPGVSCLLGTHYCMSMVSNFYF